MTWTAAQAEAWMREHPGRWLEDELGHVWHWDSESGCFVRAVAGEIVGYRSSSIYVATFHPPREVVAAEARRLMLEWRTLYQCNYDDGLERAANDLEALFPAEASDDAG